MEACNCTAMTYSFNVITTPLPLYLDGLKLCECPQFLKECDSREEALTEYHSMVYDKFCLPEKFNRTCGEDRIESISDATSRFCGQILQYRRHVEFDDWTIGFSPFCTTYAFGASKDMYDADPTASSPYNNMSGGCRQRTIFAIVVFYFLCIAIVIANITVLMVVRIDPYFHTPYGYFKASIACADLLVGVLVIPSLISHLHWLSFAPLPFRSPGLLPKSVNKSRDSFYLTVGFFTILTLSVSVYSLAASSLDRFLSISQPFRYEAKKIFTKKRALFGIVGIWLLSTIFALIPIMSSSTTYSVVSASFVLAAVKVDSTLVYFPTFPWKELMSETMMSSQDNITNFDLRSYTELFNYTSEKVKSLDLVHFRASLTSNGMYWILSMYALSLILPLIFVWIVNICTIKSFRKRRKNSVKMTASPEEEPRSRSHTFSVNTSNSNSNSTCATVATSISSVNLAEEDKIKLDEAKKLANLVKSNLQNPEKKRYLTVPSFDNCGRRSMSLTINERSPPPRLGSRSTSARSSFLSAENGEKAKQLKQEKVRKKMSNILLRMVIAFTIGILPAICSLVLHILFAAETDLYSPARYSSSLKLFQNSFTYISSVFLFGNSFINCIIYTLLGKRFRDTACSIYRGKLSTRVHNMRDTVRRISLAFENVAKIEIRATVPKVVENCV